MKKIVMLLIILLWSTSAFALESPWEKKSPFKNATIDYNITGTMNGTKTVYIKDFGRTKAEYSNTSMTVFGMVQPKKEIIITTPEWEYTIDLVENTGSKQSNPHKFMIEEFHKLTKKQQKKVNENTEKMGLSTVEGMNGTVEKNALKLLGYRCDKVTIMGTTAYTLRGTEIPLKIDANIMGIQISEVATSIKKGSVSASKFKVPSTINCTYDNHADSVMKEHAKLTIQNLLAGKPPGKSGSNSGNNNQMTPEMQQQMQNMMKMFGGQGNQ